MRAVLFIISILCVLEFQVYSQQATDSTIQWQISLTDGNKFIGFIILENESELKLKTFAYGILAIPKANIVARKSIEGTTTKKKTKPAKINAQEPVHTNEETIWRIVTDDGFDFVGKITSKTDSNIELKTEKFGTVTIQRLTINSMNIVTHDQLVDGEVWFENPQASRYFYSPNGYGMKKGEGYYQNVWVMFNQVSYGFTDYFTMGVGTVPLFLFGSDVFPVWVTPKASFPIVKDKFNLGVGAITGMAIGEGVGFGLLYGVATYGSKDKNVNLGAGYAYAAGDWAKRPTITLSTMIRTGKKGYFISENFLISSANESVGIFSFGGRTIWPRVSHDYGLVIPIYNNMDKFIAIPWLGFVIPIGQSRNGKI
jgi:hypothetical protein